MKPRLEVYSGESWADSSANFICKKIEAILNEQKCCSIMLTGGKAAQELYFALSSMQAFRELKGMRFYFGDERIVPISHSASNEGMCRNTLFKNNYFEFSNEIYGIYAENETLDNIAREYNKIVPFSIDILLLGLGDDGHIASIFPNSDIAKENKIKVMKSCSALHEYERVSITPLVVKNSKNIFLLCKGGNKLNILSRALLNINDVVEMPVRLAFSAFWLLDRNPSYDFMDIVNRLSD